MIFKETYLKSDTLTTEQGETVTLYEVSALDRMRVLDLEANADGSQLKSIEAHFCLIALSLKPGIKEFDFKTVKDELKLLPQRVITQLSNKAIELAGFGVDEGEEKEK